MEKVAVISLVPWLPGTTSFVFERPFHELPNRVLRRPPAPQNRIHLLCYRHINPKLARQIDGCRDRFDPFGHHRHGGDNICQLSSAGKFDANPAIAAQFTGAREYKVSQSGQPRERTRLAAHRHRQTGNFSQPARDQRRHRIVAQAHALTDSGPDRDDVLERRSDFDAKRIGTGIETEGRTGEGTLDGLRQIRMLRGDYDGGRLTARHLPRKCGTGQHGYSRLETAADRLPGDFRHQQQSAVFEALGRGHELRAFADVRCHAGVNCTRVFGGHHAEGDVSSLKRDCEVVRGMDAGRQFETGQEHVVLSTSLHARDEILFVSPKTNLIEPRSQNDGERRTPTACADDGEGAHLRLPNVKTYSFPARMRSIFSLCRMTMKAPATMAATTSTVGGCRISQTASGNVPAPMMEPSEIWRVTATTMTNRTATASSGIGVRYRNAPVKLATALPPLNFRNTG